MPICVQHWGDNSSLQISELLGGYIPISPRVSAPLTLGSILFSGSTYNLVVESSSSRARRENESFSLSLSRVSWLLCTSWKLGHRTADMDTVSSSSGELARRASVGSEVAENDL